MVFNGDADGSLLKGKKKKFDSLMWFMYLMILDGPLHTQINRFIISNPLSLK